MNRKNRNRAFAVAGLILALVAFYLALYLSTARYAHSDQIWWGHWLVVLIFSAPATALCCIAACLALRAKAAYPIALLILACAFPFVRGRIIRGDVNVCLSSCINHSNRWTGMFENYLCTMEARGTPVTALPLTTDFEELLRPAVDARFAKAEWVFTYFCPGWKRSENRTGIIVVGGGLPISLVREKSVLVAFCAAECHPPPSQYQFACIGMTPEWPSLVEMVGIVSQALQQAESGEIPYSKPSVQLLRKELKKRQEMKLKP